MTSNQGHGHVRPREDGLKVRCGGPFTCQACHAEYQSLTGEEKIAFMRSLGGVPIPPTASFQSRVKPWMEACFGPEISSDIIERNHRLFEEAGEYVQSKGMTESEAHQLVSYVWSRPVGDPYQEVGGVMVTLAASCLANGIDMHAAGETELARIWTKVEQIRAKQAAKPKHSPLPIAWEPPSAPSHEAPELVDLIALVFRLAMALSNVMPDNDLPNIAMGYLSKRGLMNPLRTEDLIEGLGNG